jgi:hypothetical protein
MVDQSGLLEGIEYGLHARAGGCLAAGIWSLKSAFLGGSLGYAVGGGQFNPLVEAAAGCVGGAFSPGFMASANEVAFIHLAAFLAAFGDAATPWAQFP